MNRRVRSEVKIVSRKILSLALLLALAAGCGGEDRPQGSPGTIEAHVVLPEFPFADNDAIWIDALLLDELAEGYLAGGGSADQVPQFLFSHVPLQAFDRVAGGDQAGLETLDGLLYLSGFFGGLWLKGILEPEGLGQTASVGPCDPRESHGSNPGLPRLRAVSRPRSLGDSLTNRHGHPLGAITLARPYSHAVARAAAPDPAAVLFALLSSFVGRQIDTARSADAPALNRFLLSNLDIFILLYGYNRGYLQSILDFPPAGVSPPAGYLVCDEFLDCQTPVPAIPAVEQRLPLLEKIQNPPDPAWEQMREKVDRLGPQAMETGYQVWTEFLSVEEMLPEDYQVLLDLSAGFLLYCQLLVLTSMDAWVGEDEATARTAVALSAAMTAWVGGYGIGLVSNYPGGLLPVIEVSRSD